MDLDTIADLQSRYAKAMAALRAIALYRLDNLIDLEAGLLPHQVAALDDILTGGGIDMPKALSVQEARAVEIRKRGPAWTPGNNELYRQAAVEALDAAMK